MEQNNIFTDKNGHINNIGIAKVADRLREGNENLLPDEVREHLEKCESCRDSAFDVFCATLHSERTHFTIPEMFTFNKSESKKVPSGIFFRTAATLLVLTFISIIYLYITSNRSVGIQLIEKSVEKKIPRTFNSKLDSIYNRDKQEIKKIIKRRINTTKGGTYLNPFEDNPNLEYMVDSPHRGRIIQIISPEFKIEQGGDLVFQWQNHIDKKLILKILNNKNETLYTFVAKGSKVEFSGELNPGLYYWKLEDKENLYHVGKFIVRKPIIHRTK